MPYFCRISTPANTVFFRHIVKVPADDFVSQLKAATSHYLFRSDMNVLFDLRDEVFLDDYSQLIPLYPQIKALYDRFSRSRHAYLVTNDHGYRQCLERHEKLPVDHVERLYFFSLDSAKEWLEIPPAFDARSLLENITYTYSLS